MVCCVPFGPCFMPEGMRAGGKGVLVQAPLPQGPIYLACMAWQDTVDYGAIDSAARGSAPHPCAKIWT